MLPRLRTLGLALIATMYPTQMDDEMTSNRPRSASHTPTSGELALAPYDDNPAPLGKRTTTLALAARCKGVAPPVRPKIPKTLRALVWNTHIGEERGTTTCLCGTTISQMTFECGHVIPYALGGPTTVDNLYPICGSCNRSMGTHNYATFALLVSGKVPRGMRLPPRPSLTIEECTTADGMEGAMVPSSRPRGTRSSAVWLATPDDEWVLVRKSTSNKNQGRGRGGQSGAGSDDTPESGGSLLYSAATASMTVLSVGGSAVGYLASSLGRMAMNGVWALGRATVGAVKEHQD